MALSDIKNLKKGKKCSLIKEFDTQLKSVDLFDKVLTVEDVDKIQTKNGECGVMRFKEYPEAFYFTPSLLTDLCDTILSDPEALNELRTGKDELKIKIFQAFNEKTGRNFIAYDLI